MEEPEEFNSNNPEPDVKDEFNSIIRDILMKSVSSRGDNNLNKYRVR